MLKSKREQDFRVSRGDNIKLVFSVEDIKSVQTLNEADVQWVVTDTYNKDETLLTKTTDNGVVLGSDVDFLDDHQFYIQLTNEDYVKLMGQFFWHEARVRDSAGNVNTTHSGIMEVLPSIEML